MTIKKQMYVSNFLMVFFPLAVMIFLFGGTYLRIDSLLESDAGGIPSEIFHEIAEIREWLLPVHDVFMKCVVALALVFGTLIFLSIFLSNYFLSRSLFKRILEPLNLLERSVQRIQKGDLEHSLNYKKDDEFKNICFAVDLLSKKLKEAMIERQNDEQSRKELVAGISHDLRTPLTSIRACAESLVEGIPSSIEQKKSYLKTILEKELVIERMINQLFLFSKMELSNFPLNLEIFNPRKVIEKTAQSISSSSRKFNFKIECDSSCKIKADKEQLERIAQNCIGNSLKYSDQKIPCILAQIKSDGKKIHILFKDDGPGAEGDLEKLFTLFYRKERSRKNSADGSGLGLAIVKKSMEQMGGEVFAEKNEPRGLCIHLLFDAAENKNQENLENLEKEQKNERSE